MEERSECFSEHVEIFLKINKILGIPVTCESDEVFLGLSGPTVTKTSLIFILDIFYLFLSL